MTEGNGVIGYGSAAFRSSGGMGRPAAGTDGRTILNVGYGRLDLIDATTGEVTAGPPARTVAVHGDVVAMATVDRPETIVLLGLPGLTPVDEFGAGGPVSRIALGGATVAALTAEPHALALVVDGVTRRIDLPAKGTDLVVSADGTLAVVGTDKGRSGNVLVVDVASGTVRHTLTGPRAPVTAVLISAGNDMIVAAAGPRVFGWRLDTAKPKATALWVTPEKTDRGTSLAGFTPSGRLIVVAEQAAIASVDPVTGAADWQIPAYGPALVHGDRILSSRFHDCRELDPATGAVVHTWTHRGYVNALSAVGDTIVGSGRDSRPMLFRRGATGVPELGDGHSRPVLGVAFDGDRFATTSADGRACVWRRGDPSPLFSTLFADMPGIARQHGVALDGDTLFVGDRDRLLRFDTTREAGPAARSEPLDGDVIAVVALPDRGEVLAACSKGYRNGMLYRLDARTLEVRAKAKAARTFRAWFAYTPGSATVDLRWESGFRNHEIKRFKDVGGYEYPAPRPAVYITPDHALVVHVDNHRDSTTLRISDIAARARRHEDIVIPLVRGESCMSSGGLLTTGHADAIRLWDLRAGTLAHEVPVDTAPDWSSVLRWTPGETSILITQASGGMWEVPVPAGIPGAGGE